MLNPDTSAKLAALPGVREAAEEMACEAYEAMRAAGDMLPPWGWRQQGVDQDRWARVHLTLLCDLTRPASRDWWARWLAERVFLKLEATAPRWERCRDANDRRQYEWALSADDFSDVVFGRQFTGIGGVAYSVDVNDITDPAEALAAACLAVGGAK